MTPQATILRYKRSRPGKAKYTVVVIDGSTFDIATLPYPDALQFARDRGATIIRDEMAENCCDETAKPVAQ
jgi:hypothetical protein